MDVSWRRMLWDSVSVCNYSRILLFFHNNMFPERVLVHYSVYFTRPRACYVFQNTSSADISIEQFM
jgi:hypothetical protein